MFQFCLRALQMLSALACIVGLLSFLVTLAGVMFRSLWAEHGEFMAIAFLTGVPCMLVAPIVLTVTTDRLGALPWERA